MKQSTLEQIDKADRLLHNGKVWKAIITSQTLSMRNAVDTLAALIGLVRKKLHREH